MPKKIAVAILNWNGRALLERFLPKVVEHSPEGQIYLVDNDSADDSIAWCQQAYPTVKIIALDGNYGYAGGYNRAMPQIEEELVVLLNSDIETTPNWLAPIIEAFENDPELGAAQPKLHDLKKPGFFEYAGAAGGRMDNLAYPFCQGRIFEDLEEDHGQYDQNTELFWASGASIIVRKKAFEAVGKLYEPLFAHMEEIDLCWRMQLHGWNIRLVPQSTVKHLGGATLQSASPQKTYLNFRNSLMINFLNLPHKEALPNIFSRLILDGLAGLRFLAQGKFSHMVAIIRAHFAFYGAFNQLFLEKRQRPALPFQSLSGVYAGSILWAYFVKGIKKSSEL